MIAARRIPGGRFVWIAALPAAAIVLLMLAVVWLSLTTGVPAIPGGPYSFATIASVFAAPETWVVLWNTLVFASIATALAMAGGTALAWILERTDFPAPRLVYAAITIVLLVPGFFPSMGWLFFLGPRIGIVGHVLHQTFGLPQDAITIANPVGMGLVQGLLLLPLAFVLVAPALRSVSGELFEAAQAHGLGLWDRIARIELPLVTPALIAAAIYSFMVALASFDIPGFIGLTYRQFTFSTYIYELLNAVPGTPQYGPPAALGLFAMAVAFGLTAVYLRAIRRGKAFQVVTGRAYRSSPYRLGRATPWVFAAIGVYLVLVVLMPLLLVVWVALSPYFQVPSIAALANLSLANFVDAPWNLAWRGLQNTLVLVVVVPLAAVSLGLIVAWVVVRSRSPIRGAIDVAVFLPHAVPGIVFAMAMQSVAVLALPRFVSLAGTVWIIALVYLLAHLSFAVRSLSTSIVQIGADLEEAAHVGGLSVAGTLRYVFLPLVSPAALNALVWIALLSFRELTMAVVLFTPANITLPTVIWSTWYGGGMGQASAMSLAFMALFSPFGLVYFLRSINRRPGETPLGAEA